MTQRGSLLRRQIAVRTSAQWDDVVPGFFEADLVAHNGGNQYGQFIYTLTMTDISSGWTECAPLMRKDDKYVTITLRNVANTSSFLYHLDQFINDDVLNQIGPVMPALADSLKTIKSIVKDENQQVFRTIYQTFSWTVYAPLFKGYCGKG